MKFEEYVNTIPTEDLHKCIQQWEEMQKEGNLGDCELRQYADGWIDNSSTYSTNVVFVMRDIVFTILMNHYKATGRNV